MSGSLWGSRRFGRRAVLRGGMLGAMGLAGAALIGCSGDDDEATPTQTAAGSGTPAGTPTAGSSAPTASTMTRGGEIKHARGNFISGLDSDYSTSGNFYHSLVFDPLLAFTDGQPAVADMSLASGLEIVDDTTLVFTLREGINFSDGTPFNAEAVKFNIERGQRTDPAGSVNLTTFANIVGVEAVDPKTVRFNLSAPDPALFSNLARAGGLMGSPAHYADKAPADVRWNPVGTGPWKFDSFGEDQFIRWVPFADHWRKASDGGSVAIADVFEMNVIPDPTVLVASLETGDVNIIESPFSQLGTLDANSKLTSTFFPGRSTLSGYVNHGLAPTDNVDVRRALAWSWDAAAFNRLFFSDRMITATSLLPSHSWAYTDAGLPGYDVAMAKTMIERSGVAPADLVVRVAVGDTQQFQFLQAAWAEIGVTAEHIPSQEASGRLYKNRGEAADIHISVNDFNFRLDPHAQLSLQLSEKAVFNMGAAPVGEIEDLLVKGASTYDVEERKSIYAQIQKIQGDQLYGFIPKLELSHIQHHGSDVIGVRYHADATPYLAEAGYA